MDDSPDWEAMTRARIERARGRRQRRQAFQEWHDPRRAWGLEQRKRDKDARMRPAEMISLMFMEAGKVIAGPYRSPYVPSPGDVIQWQGAGWYVVRDRRFDWNSDLVVYLDCSRNG